METAERERIATRLHAAAIHLLRAVRREDPASGLSPARLSALSVLVYGGPRTIGALAAAEQVTPPTMTRLVAALEADGYVAREPSPRDGRAVIVHATPRAHEALEAARRRRVAQLLGLLAGLSDGEWARLGEAVTSLETALETALEVGRGDGMNRTADPAGAPAGGATTAVDRAGASAGRTRGIAANAPAATPPGGNP